jgi:mannose-1-phosphate guanylyltransferase
MACVLLIQSTSLAETRKENSRSLMTGNRKSYARGAVILAGGEGARLRSLTHHIMGYALPKQFCPVVGDKTLLEQTRSRVALAVPPERTMIVVTRVHEPHYRPLLSDTHRSCVVTQPRNRETAPAILYALLRLAKICPETAVAIFPSDHFISDDRAFMRHIDDAFDAVTTRPDLAVLLGVTAASPEPGYGWIEPGEAIDAGGVRLSRIESFIEKPTARSARKLWKRGCLWNSFVMVGTIATLMRATMRALPALRKAFSAVRPSIGTPAEDKAVETLYESIPASNFSHAVLSRFAERWAVMPVRGVRWSDLGEPDRVHQALALSGISPRWKHPAAPREQNNVINDSAGYYPAQLPVPVR